MVEFVTSLSLVSFKRKPDFNIVSLLFHLSELFILLTESA